MIHLRNYTTGFLQVMLVVLNTWQIAHERYTGAIIVGFLISLVWTFNVRAALGTWPERLTYSLGAASGTALGLYIPKLLYTLP